MEAEDGGGRVGGVPSGDAKEFELAAAAAALPRRVLADSGREDELRGG